MKGKVHINLKNVAFWILGIGVSIICILFILQHTGVIMNHAQSNLLESIQSVQDDALTRYKFIAYNSQKNAIEAEAQRAREKQIAEQKMNEIACNTPEADTPCDENQILTKNEYGEPVYIIERGDTLAAISAKVLYSVDELAEYNKIKNVNLIYADSALRVPNEN